jgi:carboxyl-terminal processing protease
VLDLVEREAYYADRIDWMQWRVDATDEAATAQRTADTYDFVQRLLLELGDHHSGFFPSPSSEEETVPTMPFTRPSGAVGADAIGRLTLPGFSGDTTQAAEYVAAAQDVVAVDACGWIVDLRGNPGGNLFPMLAALAPLLGPGPLVGYQHRDGTIEPFVLDDSGVVIAPGGSVLARAPGSRPVRFTVGLPIAVIHGPGTASSGEGVVMALRGRPGVRSFGRPTDGVPTGNQLFELSDGSAINLTVAVGVDYGGDVHESSIAPDVVSDTSGGTDEARVWLTHQASCRGIPAGG